MVKKLLKIITCPSSSKTPTTKFCSISSSNLLAKCFSYYQGLDLQFSIFLFCICFCIGKTKF